MNRVIILVPSTVSGGFASTSSASLFLRCSHCFLIVVMIKVSPDIWKDKRLSFPDENAGVNTIRAGHDPETDRCKAWVLLSCSVFETSFPLHLKQVSGNIHSNMSGMFQAVATVMLG